jgi:hypothetical protein
LNQQKGAFSSLSSGLADAKANGYVKQETLGYVWPPPGSVPGVASRYGLPSITKDDRAYVDQDYWHGRIWCARKTASLFVKFIFLRLYVVLSLPLMTILTCKKTVFF